MTLEEYQVKNEQLQNALNDLIKYAEKTLYYWEHNQDSKVGKRLFFMAGFNPNYEPDLKYIHELVKKV